MPIELKFYRWEHSFPTSLFDFSVAINCAVVLMISINDVFGKNC